MEPGKSRPIVVEFRVFLRLSQTALRPTLRPAFFLLRRPGVESCWRRKRVERGRFQEVGLINAKASFLLSSSYY